MNVQWQVTSCLENSAAASLNHGEDYRTKRDISISSRSAAGLNYRIASVFPYERTACRDWGIDDSLEEVSFIV